ncbi:MAG: HEAT repeat domain-containing protein [Acidimicrobiales bacterium]
MATAPSTWRLSGRRRAAVLAGHLGDEALARSSLHDPDASVRGCALGALARLGAVQAGDLLRAWADPAAAVRRRACEIAAQCKAPVAAPLSVVGLLSDHDGSVVEAACYALGELLSGPLGQSTSKPPELGKCLAALESIARSHNDPLCREAAVAALGAIGHPASLPTVLACLDDKPAIRRRAVIGLAAFEGPAAQAALERALSDHDWQVRQVAQDLLDRRPQPAAR